MKKRLVAVILSLFMCTSMVSEAGAAAFTSPDAAVSDVETDTRKYCDRKHRRKHRRCGSRR